MAGVALRLFVLCFFASTVLAATENRIFVCYYGSWAGYRTGNGRFEPEDIDANLCTHVIYTFVGLNEVGAIKLLDPYWDLPDNYGKNGIQRFINLKRSNPNLKLLIAIGGWNEGSVKYSNTLKDSTKRKKFILDTVDFIKRYGFDGFDIDWEYPNQRGGVPADVSTYTSLIKEMRAEYDKHGFLISAAVPVVEDSFSKSYNVPALSQYLDFINIMAYDVHGSYEPKTGHNAPLYSAKAELGTHDANMNIDHAIQAWIRHGAAPEKLILGLAMYGRSFTLSSTSCDTPRCPSSAPGASGPFTVEAGFLGYNEICLEENKSGVKLGWDEEAKVPYLVKGKLWVSYDNERSLQEKIDYIKKNKLGGGMVWTIETDDFRGDCGKGKYPLLKAINAGLFENSEITPSPSTEAPSSTTTSTTTTTTTTPKPTTTSAPTTTTTTTTTPKPTTEAPSTTTTTTTPEPSSTTTAYPQTEVCKKEGYNRDPYNCAVFYQCTWLGDKFKSSKFVCSSNLVFDTVKNVCNYVYMVQC